MAGFEEWRRSHSVKVEPHTEETVAASYQEDSAENLLAGLPDYLNTLVSAVLSDLARLKKQNSSQKEELVLSRSRIRVLEAELKKAKEDIATANSRSLTWINKCEELSKSSLQPTAELFLASSPEQCAEEFAIVQEWASKKMEAYDPLSLAKTIFNVDDLYDKELVNIIYKTLVKKYHPDMGGSTRAIQVINASREVLLSTL